ncbi:MAG: tetratricopeptide repeat protein [Bacteroidales bacterium]
MCPDDSPRPPSPDSEVTQEADDHRPHDRIGPYHLLQKIGEGGMGEVWVAEQHEPIRRTVAVKVIKIGMDTRQVVARFEAERQALALMDHPGIAKVLDAGSTARGRAYFVMEYVHGEPITTYCDRHRLSNADRLQLFTLVCEAVQHAHQKGIIHRDLKPSNVLVAIQGEQPVPKIIDFGIAKATAHRLTEQSVFTELGVLIGTPEYMSPEQAEMTGLDIDTRTDVYSLGVMLYELLTGALPFDGKALRHAALDELRRQIREVDPPRPSTRISMLGDASVVAARNRKTETTRLASQVKGDLDWITMKALEKDRTRRYGAVSDLAADIGRHLSHQPVLASPPSTTYRMGKFVRRHRAGVAVAAAAVIVLVAFAATMAVQARRIAWERDRANREAAAAKQVTDFLVGLFTVSDPSETRGNSVTAREILDRGADKIVRDLQRQPLVQGRLMDTMGYVYYNLGLLDPAQALLQKAQDSRETFLGPDDPEVADTLAHLGSVMWRKGDLAQAKPLMERSLAIREKRFGGDSTLVASSLHNLGNLNWTQGNYAEARRLLERALAIRQKVLGAEHSDVASTLNSLGAIAYREGDLKRAGMIWEQTLAIREKVLGPDHPWLAQTLNNLAVVYTDSGELDRALPLLRRVVEIQEKVLGPTHPDLASGLANVGEALSKGGNFSEAKTYLGRAIAIMEVASPNNPEQARFLDRLAFVLLKENDLAGARKLYERSLVIRQKALGATNPEVAASLGGLADCASKAGRLPEAEAFYERASAILRKPDGSYYSAASDVLAGFPALLRATHRDVRAAEIEVEIRSAKAR